MTAMACLRVAVEADRTGIPPATLGPLVQKFASAYLETRWRWPRRFAPLTHYSFLLSDPRSDQLDVQELDRMSDELQVKLFGEVEDGEVDLLLFEGPPDAVTAFAAMDAATVDAALTDPSLLPPGGRLSIVSSCPPREEREPQEPDVEAAEPEGPDWVEQRLGARSFAPAQNATPMPQLDGLQGIYFTQRELFIGDVVSSTPGTARNHFSLVEGPEHMPADPYAFDADCVSAALRYFQNGGVEAMLYLPVCYSNIVRPSERARYEAMFATLPPCLKPRLAAAVYDAPRAPHFSSLSLLRITLGRYFTNIDLRTSDPRFEIEQLTPRAVSSVTLVLPQGPARERLAALRRFTERLDLYKTRRIWAAVSNIRTKAELEACAAARVPFVTGPGVCRMQTLPVGGRLHPLSGLPVLAA